MTKNRFLPKIMVLGVLAVVILLLGAFSHMEQRATLSTVTFYVAGGQGVIISEAWSALNEWEEPILLTSGQALMEHDCIQFIAIPAPNYYFAYWAVDGDHSWCSGTEEFHWCVGLGDVTITVRFESLPHMPRTVDFSVTEGQGTLTAVSSTEVEAGDIIAEGNTIAFIATPKDGYRVASWTVDGAYLTGIDTDTIRRVMVGEEDVAVTVAFEPISFVPPGIRRVTFMVDGGQGDLAGFTHDTWGGTAGGQPAVRYINVGEIITFQAIGLWGQYHIASWDIAGSSLTGSPTNTVRSTVVGAENIVVTVTFEPIPYGMVPVYFEACCCTPGELTATARSIPITWGETVAEGDVIIFSATPNEGYMVHHWYEWSGTLHGGSRNPVRSLIVGDEDSIEIGIHFEPVELIAPLRTVTLINTAFNGLIYAEVRGIWLESGQTVMEGETLRVFVRPGRGSRFVSLTVNGVPVAGVTPATREIWFNVDVGAEDIVIIADFEVIPNALQPVTFSVAGGNGTLTAILHTVNWGSMPIASGETAFAYDGLTFTATPAVGYRIAGWNITGGTLTGDLTGASRGATLGTEPMNVTVIFEPIQPLVQRTVEFSTTRSPGQTISPPGTITATVNGIPITSGQSVAAGETVVFTAAPHEGYTVRTWMSLGLGGTLTGESRANVRSIVVGDADIRVNVSFEEAPVPVTFSVAGGQGELIASIWTSGHPITTGQAFHDSPMIRFTAIPAPGYQVATWTRNGYIELDVHGRTEFVASIWQRRPLNVTVTFEPIPVNMHEVHFEVMHCCAYITALVDGNPIESGDAVPEGKTVTFIITLPEYYRVYFWGGLYEDIFPEGDNSTVNSLVVGTEDIWVVVWVAPLESDTINFWVVEGQGELIAMGLETFTPIEDGGSIGVDCCVVFIASPANGYRVASWEINGEEMQTSCIAMPLWIPGRWTHVVTVTFEPILEDEQRTIIFYVADGQGTIEVVLDHGWDMPVSIPVSFGQVVCATATIRFVATPAEGYRVFVWLVDGWIQQFHFEEFYWWPWLGDAVISVIFEPISSASFSDVITFDAPYQEKEPEAEMEFIGEEEYDEYSHTYNF